MMIARHIISLSLVALLLTACVGSSPTEPSPTPVPLPATSPPSPTATLLLPEVDFSSLSGEIKIDGSSTVFPITERVALAFNELSPQVTIRLGVSGTGGGFSRFCAGETDISNASRPIKQSEMETCTANGITFVELPVAFDGLSVVVHPQNDWVQCLTVAELKRMWSPEAETVITRWNQIRADWPDAPLHLYGAGTDSGTYDYFTSAIVGQEGISRRDYTASEDDYLLAQDVAGDQFGLGFFGYAYYAEYADRLRAVAIDNGNGCVAPSIETISNGQYQPLARPIFIYVRADRLARAEVRTFVDLYLQNGSLFASQALYVPLPSTAYELALRRVERRRTGSIFSGGSQVGLSIEQLLQLEDR
ncbi:PstS family phosphate ABC transporter substrate-binding protein [Chloroflexus aggregans]|uniref:Phosphate-binding protein n=1 Tax=Chloroflexus aggregans (strain MD-66 / DSM 9485) TaxID=326427 RepID=B8G3Q1_CHLAD|nr:PstS family phosphate ABC transporter substrate-binding protein [Chloroflexus aggregans]ACL23434.1 phosphate binding protein [Chloroflexus aggregans DSM 9485]